MRERGPTVKLGPSPTLFALPCRSPASPRRRAAARATFVAIALLVAARTHAASAQTLGVSTSPPNAVNTINNGDYTIGFTFNVTSAFLVSALGYWDNGDDGLSESHTVGIY